MHERVADCRDQVVHTLHRVLERDNSLSRCCAARALGRMNVRDDESRKRLVALLLDPDPDVRMDAAATLGQLRIGEATEPLVYNLENDPEGEVRIETVKALGRIRCENAVDPLIRCLEADGYPHLDEMDMVDDVPYSACWEVQSQSLDALGEIGSARATESVIAFLESDEYEDLQESGLRVLAQLDSERARQFLLTRLKHADRLVRRRAARAFTTVAQLKRKDDELPPEVVAGLVEALVDSDPVVRIYAARALAGTQHHQVVVPLTMLLSDPDVEVRSEVASVLAAMRGAEIVDRLHAMLDEPDPAWRRRVVRVLGSIGDSESLAPLSLLLDTDDSDLLYEVVGALGRIGQRGPEGKIAAIVEDVTIHPSVRVQAAAALPGIVLDDGSGGDRRSAAVAAPGVHERSSTPECDPREVLARAALDESESVCQAALASLVQIDPAAAIPMLACLVRGEYPRETQLAPVRSGENPLPVADSGAAQTASEGDEPDIPPALHAMLAGHDATTSTLASIIARSADEETVASETEPESAHAAPGVAVRRLAARLLGGLPSPGPEAVAALTLASGEQDIGLRKAALIAIGRIGGEAALPVMIDALAVEEPETRLAALDAVRRFAGVAKTDPHLVPLLRDPDPQIRQRVVQILGDTGTPAALEHLPRMLDDASREVCRAALHGLSPEMKSDELSSRIVGLMFRFSGELKRDAAATLRRLHDGAAATRLLGMLENADDEECHWICVDALGELFAPETGQIREISRSGESRER